MMRIGFSKDIHRLGLGRKLVVGGVEIPHHLGCVAHSDGDVVFHAIGEAILGALALGDLGKYFPTNDPKLDGINSSYILTEIYQMMTSHHYEISNIDTQIVLQRPKLANYIDQMRQNIADILHCKVEQISIKAGTKEGLDSIGEGIAIECSAICLLNKIENDSI